MREEQTIDKDVYTPPSDLAQLALLYAYTHTLLVIDDREPEKEALRAPVGPVPISPIERAV
jgi:hypothetical protein